MIDFSSILIYGSILSLISTAIIFTSLRINPRLWLQDYPKEIQKAVPPKTKEEKKQSLMWGIPFLVVLIAVPLFSCIQLKQQSIGNVSYMQLFLNAFGIGFFFNVVDLVLIDWLVVCAFTPKFIILPGTEGMQAYKDYGFHFKAFLTGTVLSIL